MRRDRAELLERLGPGPRKPSSVTRWDRQANVRTGPGSKGNAPGLGEYVIIKRSRVNAGVSLSDTQIESLEKGTCVEVVEIQCTEERWRARIQYPAGWITLQKKDGSEAWAEA